MTQLTPSTDNAAGIIAIILFIVRELWNIYREKNKPRVDNSQASLTDAQAEKIRAEIQRDVLQQAHDENKELAERVNVLESALEAERKARAIEHESEVKARTVLEARLTDIAAELDQYKMGVGLLMGQLIKNNIKPTWTPPGVSAPDVEPSGGGLIGGRR